MCRSPSSIVAKWRTRLAVLPVVSPVAGCTVAPLEETGDASPPSRVGVVADVGGLTDRSFNPSAWQGVLATAKPLGLTEDKDCRCVETIEPENYTQHIGEFVDSEYDVIVPADLALGNATVAVASKHLNIDFISVDQFRIEILPNLTDLGFREDQAGKQASLLAGCHDHADSASLELQQSLTEMRGGFCDMLATGHE